jgi:hypothetical protein
MPEQPFKKRIISLLFIIFGTALVGVAVFAYALGLDNNSEWGRSRTILTTTGVGFWLISGIWFAWSRVMQQIARFTAGQFAGRVRFLRRNGQRWFDDLVVVRWARRVAASLESFLQRLPGYRYWYGPEQRWVAPATILACLFVLLAYWWFITAGKMFEWTTSSYYYNLLADAFLKGQVHLLIEPGKELLALPNPYDWDARQVPGVEHLWDITLFDGKFFIYWGPVPALFLMPIKLLLPGSPVLDDQYLMLGFLSAAFLASVGLLALVWKQYFRDEAGWLLPVAVLVIGFSNPSFWMLGRPSVYETAVVSGQFWMVFSLLLAYTSLSGGSSRRDGLLLFISGLSLACAVGSRALLAPAAIFSSLIILWQLKKRSNTTAEFWPAAIAFGAPLLVGAGLLMGYNIARFKDPFEIGLRYQLTGPAMQHYELVTSIKYVLPNLYNNLMRIPLLEADFPFVSAIFISETMWPFYIRLPQYYVFHEPVVGMFIIAPTLLFLAACVSYFFPAARRTDSGDFSSLRWLVLCLAGNLAITAGLIMIYIFSAMRFQFELLLPGNLLALLGVWRLRKFLVERPGLQKLVSMIFLLSAVITIACGWLLGMGEPGNRFEEINPVLYYTIAFTLNGIW